MTIILNSDELEGVTGYRTPKRQLEELHRQGFYRARIAVTGCGLHSQQKGDQVHGYPLDDTRKKT